FGAWSRARRRARRAAQLVLVRLAARFRLWLAPHDLFDRLSADQPSAISNVVRRHADAAGALRVGGAHALDAAHSPASARRTAGRCRVSSHVLRGIDPGLLSV